jgi:polysaccharide export outer membrane protein
MTLIAILRSRPRWEFLAVLLAILAPAGPRMAAQDAPPVADKSSATTDLSYRLGPGDVIDIRVFGRPQLTSEAVRIDENGRIRLPLIAGDIQAACQSEETLAQTIAKGYREYLVDPQVTVSIRQYSSQIVNLVGAVQRPGSFQLQRRVKLRELVSLAGGVSPTAGDTIMVVSDEHRAACNADPVDGNQGVTMFDSAAVLGGVDAANPYVMPGDFVNVNEAGLAYVVGNVVRPSPVALAKPVSLTRALAIVGGRLPGSRNIVHIVRKVDSQGKITVLSFSMKEILTNKQEDPFLKTGDIVDVDTSISKALLKTTVGAFASVGAVYYPLTYIK